MRRKIASGETVPRGTVDKPAEPHSPKVTLPCDTTNEAVLLAAAFLFPDVRAQLVSRLVPDHFAQREHHELWKAFQEAERRKLALDLAVVEQLGSTELSRYLEELCAIRPNAPENLAYHVQTLLWDHARISAARGPIPAFIEALRDPKSEPDKVRGLARAVGQSFDGYEDRKYLLDPDAIVRDQMKEIERRVSGHATFSCGIPGLDFFDPAVRDRRRMIPGTAPGQLTVITGVSGSGKTTMTASMVLGIAFPGWLEGNYSALGRRVLYCAWEMRGGMTLELLSCISLGWSRSEVIEGRGPIITPEGREQLLDRMTVLASRIRFLGNPFRRARGEKRSNERNLDIVQGYIADSGCEIFIADLWKRALARTEPDEEEEALIRQQAMVEELNVHGILLQQQRLKDIEMRADKRPTREGIKGSGAWIEIPDTIIGIHRPALFMRCDDVVVEAFILKQRYGKWPMGVEFRWDPETGSIRGGRDIPYDRPGETNEIDRVGLSDFYGKKK